MPTEFIDDQVMRALVQAGGAILLCLGVVALCRHYGLRIGREASVSLVRGLIQMALVGVLLGLLLTGGALVAGLILAGMVAAAGWTAARRLPEIEGALAISVLAIGVGAGTVILFMIAIRAVEPHVSILVPVGSMIIANSMNACAQGMERFKSDVTAHVGQVEAALSLGAAAPASVSPFVQSAVYASLLPRLDMLKSLGLVWIPGVMAGMMVSGASPLYAGIFQFIIVAMILAASGISGTVAIVLMRGRVFSPAAQLLLRPAAKAP
ncbi:ABC transporter permease [Ancylobacter amanitiformis]|uniref:ABC transport system permease protein n=1 Tax=Ancylobacter amanitiformis TaxID=217069 RepID=A0ABU0LUW6_9HYPH|nr:ABC transporter permease [Ancylobacter amanitiformis]MDQ0512462.1 putative ABC transport system permease protein [Ancylobacter amanitiformis]